MLLISPEVSVIIVLFLFAFQKHVVKSMITENIYFIIFIVLRPCLTMQPRLALNSTSYLSL